MQEWFGIDKANFPPADEPPEPDTENNSEEDIDMPF